MEFRADRNVLVYPFGIGLGAKNMALHTGDFVFTRLLYLAIAISFANSHIEFRCSLCVSEMYTGPRNTISPIKSRD